MQGPNINTLREKAMNSYNLNHKTILTQKQIDFILESIIKKNTFSKETVIANAEWFFDNLQFADYYFQTTSIEMIANHLECIIASRILAESHPDKKFQIDFKNELPDKAIYIVNDSYDKTAETERLIEKKYSAYRLESYRTTENSLAYQECLRMYFVSMPKFKHTSWESHYQFDDACEVEFKTKTLSETYERYKKVWTESQGYYTPYIYVSEKEDTNEMRIMIALNKDNVKNFTSRFSDVMTSYDVYTQRKYVEPFLDGKVIFSFYLRKTLVENILEHLLEDISLISILPETSLNNLMLKRELNAKETLYCVAALHFVHQFISTFNEEYIRVSKSIKDNPEVLGTLQNLKTHLVKDTYTFNKIKDTVVDYRGIVKELYEHFRLRFHPHLAERKINELEDKIGKQIKKEVSSDLDREILSTFLIFNNSILKTNFYKHDKNALAFRLDSSFLNQNDYSLKPVGFFFICGTEFFGFHIRFREIARGGVRIVRSRNLESFYSNADSIFDENYDLARTQESKNKDIPEGGAKGTILLRAFDQDKGEIAFKKYIDGLLDVLLPSKTIVDYYKKEELIFLGPDEGTAGYMDWAALHARERGYKFWKAFTTGKSKLYGGIPHDEYGMTTQGVHEYVLCILDKLNLKEENTTKFQTGGPDGDLGSNEIKISKDRTIAVADGSGVLCDPQGINREELVKLANKRIMIKNFDRTKISKNGFLVTVEDQNLKLPDGTLVENGEDFRNKFPLFSYARADLFVPCGGRPRSINIGNWSSLLNKEGKPAFKYIVEGANLFISQPARLRLEEHGVVLIKDSSANKGGVTSSSFEVLLSLSLSDAEYDKLATVNKDGNISEFRKNYIKDVIATIKKNARLEFELMWSEHTKTKIPMSILSDTISNKINDIAHALENSALFENEKIRKALLTHYLPPSLLEIAPYATISKRIPQAYIQAICSSFLAQLYIYKHGLNANEIDFYQFVSDLENRL